MNKLCIRDDKGRRKMWVIKESVHVKGRVYVNIVRAGKVRTLRVR